MLLTPHYLTITLVFTNFGATVKHNINSSQSSLTLLMSEPVHMMIIIINIYIAPFFEIAQSALLHIYKYRALP